jgi:hypothetical protein
MGTEVPDIRWPGQRRTERQTANRDTAMKRLSRRAFVTASAATLAGTGLAAAAAPVLAKASSPNADLLALRVRFDDALTAFREAEARTNEARTLLVRLMPLEPPELRSPIETDTAFGAHIRPFDGAPKWTAETLRGAATGLETPRRSFAPSRGCS